MNAPDRLGDLRVNPDWAKLPLFERKGWQRMRFGDFADSINERIEPADAADEPYVGLEDLNPGDLHIRRWGKGSDVIGTKLRFRKGDIIFGRRRAYQRKLAVAAFDGICSAHAMVVRAKPDVVLPEFLPFLMMSDRFMKRAVEISVGSLSPTINWTTLRFEEFDLPPLEQQKAIAELFVTLDDALANHSQVCTSLTKLHASKRDAFCGQFGPKRKLGEALTYLSDGPFGSKLKTEHYAEKGARVVRLQNIGAGFFDDSDKAYISMKYYDELSRYAVYPGDVLVAGLGDETHPVGRAAIYPERAGPAINKADCFCLRANTSILDSQYLTHFLNSQSGVKQIAARSQGTTRARINVGNISRIEVTVPAIDEQQRVVRELLAIKHSVHSAARASSDAETLSRHLSKLFFA